jgi:CHAD domain-containing protein
MQRLRDERVAKRDAVRAALKGDSWSILELYFSLWPRTLNSHGALGWPVEKIASKALRQSWKRAARLGKRLRELTPKQRHDMRKALKQFRYSIEFFGPLYGARKVRNTTAQLKELQNVFGYLNDVAVARQLEPISNRQNRENAACQQAATFVLGWHTAQSEVTWEKANSLWQRLNRKRNIFW